LGHGEQSLAFRIPEGVEPFGRRERNTKPTR
jgi:hypothetical protein